MPLRFVDRKTGQPVAPGKTVAPAPDNAPPAVACTLNHSRSTATFGKKKEKDAATFSFAPSTRASQRSKSSVHTSGTSSSSNEARLRRQTPPPDLRKGRPRDNFAVGDEVDHLRESRCWVPTVVTKVGPSTGLISVANGQGGINPHNLRPRRRPDLAQLLWVRRTLLEGRLNVEAEALFSRHAAAGASGVELADGDPVIAVETLKPKDAEPDTTIEAGTRGVLKERTRDGDLRINWGASLGLRRTPCRHARKVARLELPARSLGEVGAEMEELLGVSGCMFEMKARARHDAERRVAAAEEAATGAAAQTTADPNAASMPPAVFREVFWEQVMAAHSTYGLSLSDSPVRAKPDEVWKDYAEKEDLGRGPYGSVHLSQHKPSGTQRVVKKILWRQASVSRAEVLSQLERLSSCEHPSIAQLLEHFKGPPLSGNDLLCLAVAHNGGVTLEKALRANQQAGELPHEIVLGIMRQTFGAVSHMHARGLLHLALACSSVQLSHKRKKRSTSPAPVAGGGTGAEFLSADWPPHVYVMDFGLASIFTPEDGWKRRSGTPSSSLAPELSSGLRTPPADVFGCGVIFFRLLTLKALHEVPASTAKAVEWWKSNLQLGARGRRVGDEAAHHHASGAADAPSSPPVFFRLCDRMLAKHRHDRPTVEQCLREASFV